MKTSKYLLAAAAAALFLGGFDQTEASSRVEQTALLTWEDVVFSPDRLTEAQRSIFYQPRYITENECAQLRDIWLRSAPKKTPQDYMAAQKGMEFALGNRPLCVCLDQNEIGDVLRMTGGGNHIPLTVVRLLEKASLENTLTNSKIPLSLETLQGLHELTIRKTKEEKDLRPVDASPIVSKERKKAAICYLERFFWGEEQPTEEEKSDIADLIAGKGQYSPGAAAR